MRKPARVIRKPLSLATLATVTAGTTPPPPPPPTFGGGLSREN